MRDGVLADIRVVASAPTWPVMPSRSADVMTARGLASVGRHARRCVLRSTSTMQRVCERERVAEACDRRSEWQDHGPPLGRYS